MIDVCLLGTGGMMPLEDRWLASVLIRCNGRMILIDCGEGTQIPLKLCGWGFKAIDVILFTHYHADHVAGLPGLLLALGNSGREEPLTLIGPPGIKEVVEGLTVISPDLPYALSLFELPDNKICEVSLNDINLINNINNVNNLAIRSLVLRSAPVDHRIPCLSYSLELKRQGKFYAERARMLNIPVKFWKKLQKGETITLDGRVIYPEMVLGEARKGIKISYCTDTRPTESIIDFIKDSDLFICEGMYGDNENFEKAVQKKHMTFKEAAELARKGNVKELWLTHYSPSLKNPEEYIEAVKAIFANVHAGKDLYKKTITYS